MVDLVWYPWTPRDFAADTKGWPICARGVYRELLDTQWDQDGLPTDPRDLRAIVHCTELEWRTAWRRCEKHFPVVGDKRRNPRLEKERVIALHNRANAVERGKAGAASRWTKHRQSNAQSIDRAMDGAMLEQCPPPPPLPKKENPPVLTSPPPSRAGTNPPRANGAGRPKGPGEDRIKTPPGYPEPIGDIAKRAIARMRKSAGVKTDDDLPPIA